MRNRYYLDTKSKKIVALIVAAGKSERFGGDTPKQYRFLLGKRLLRYSVEQFYHNPNISAVCVVIDDNHRKLYEDAIKGLDLFPVVKGGESRRESVLFGLRALSKIMPDYILIHDAARPFVSGDIIDAVIEKAVEKGSAVPVISLQDTVKKCQDDNIVATIDRKDLYCAQTPQGFRFSDILAVHEDLSCKKNVNYSVITDDAAVLEQLGHKVGIVEGSDVNFKITAKSDWQKAERLLYGGSKTVIGSGFDVHRFCEPKQHESDNAVILGGVNIPCIYSLEGHSDADVVLHALTDAILGAIGEGDIGEHFPPSDKTNKDRDSAEFLKFAVDLLSKKSGYVNNADVTIICQIPKITPYKETMREKIAAILGVAESVVNIKATTTEGLGFTGRNEGIVVQASVCCGIHNNNW